MAQAVGGRTLERQPALTRALLIEIANGVVRKRTDRGAGAEEQFRVRCNGPLAAQIMSENPFGRPKEGSDLIWFCIA